MNLEQARQLWQVGRTKASRHCETLQQYYPGIVKGKSSWSIPEGIPIPMDPQRVKMFAQYHLRWLNNRQAHYDWIACGMTGKEDLNLFSLVCYDLVMPPKNETAFTVDDLVLSEKALSLAFNDKRPIEIQLNLTLNFSLLHILFPGFESPC